MHLGVVLLGPRRLWRRHLSQQEKVSGSQGCLTVAGFAIHLLCQKEGLQHIWHQAVVECGLRPVFLMTLVLPRPGLRKARLSLGKLARGRGRIRPDLRKASIFKLPFFEQAGEPGDRRLMHAGVLKAKGSVEVDQKAEGRLGFVVVEARLVLLFGLRWLHLIGPLLSTLCRKLDARLPAARPHLTLPQRFCGSEGSVAKQRLTGGLVKPHEGSADRRCAGRLNPDRVFLDNALALAECQVTAVSPDVAAMARHLGAEEPHGPLGCVLRIVAEIRLARRGQDKSKHTGNDDEVSQ